MAVKSNTKRLAVSAMLSALGVVLLSLGAVVQVMDISMAVIASLCAVVAVIEYGKATPWLIYAATGVLSLMIIPNNSAAMMYILFFGFYPIIKEKLEKRKKWLSWLLKEIVFNVSLALMLGLSRLLLTADTSEPWYIFGAFVLLAEVAFPLYDIALTRIISLYIFKIRSRFRIK